MSRLIKYPTAVVPALARVVDDEVVSYIDSERSLFGDKFTFISKMNLLYVTTKLTQRQYRLFIFMHCTANKGGLVVWSPTYYKPYTKIDSSCLSSVKKQLLEKGLLQKMSRGIYKVADMKKPLKGASLMIQDMRSQWWPDGVIP